MIRIIMAPLLWNTSETSFSLIFISRPRALMGRMWGFTLALALHTLGDVTSSGLDDVESCIDIAVRSRIAGNALGL